MSIFILLLNFSCKKENNSFIKDQFSDVYFVKKADAQLFGTVHESSTAKVQIEANKQVFVPNLNYQSYSFGDLLRLDNNSILCISSRFKVLDDFLPADFVSKTSLDNGATWGEEKEFLANQGGLNIMSPNLLRIDAKKVLFVFLNKLSKTEIDIYIKESNDNAKTFSTPRKINTINGYQVLNNARIVRLKSGRIILPISINGANNIYSVFCYYSDDLGKTWNTSSLLTSDITLQEPAVTELSNGELIMCIRTQTGFVYFSKSLDKGLTWKNLFYSELVAPEAPATMFKYGEKLAIIWNNTPYVANEYRNRTPLIMALSSDMGNSWDIVGSIESNQSYQYSYVSAIAEGENIFITYYKRARQDDRSQLLFSKLKIAY